MEAGAAGESLMNMTARTLQGVQRTTSKIIYYLKCAVQLTSINSHQNTRIRKVSIKTQFYGGQRRRLPLALHQHFVGASTQAPTLESHILSTPFAPLGARPRGRG